ncbi:MAG: purine-nucleoside phosphorylase [Chloroflexia bacterium]|nr:purine-nucleoside phosphorylase [Chloroflexia bacterium]
MSMHLSEQIQASVAAIRQYSDTEPLVGLILGSGLGTLVESIEGGVAVPYDQIPHMAPSTVLGHQGQFILGRLADLPVVAMQGRLHFYEGYSMGQTTFPVRVMRALGCQVLIVTNAAGGIHPDYQVGDVMRIVDHVNLLGMAGNNPLYGPNDPALGPRFVELGEAYDLELGALADEVAGELDLSLQHGIYAQLSGPSFETPAEIRFLRLIGADAVGMSTAAEVVVARHGGMRVLGFSHISNVALGEPPRAPAEPQPALAAADPHHEVLEAGRRAIPHLEALIRGVLQRLPEVL